MSNLKARFGKLFKKCREHKNKIVKAAATAALINPMSCAGRNYREVLNACYDKKIIYNKWNSKCDEMKECVNKCFEGDDWYKRWVQTVLYFM